MDQDLKSIVGDIEINRLNIEKLTLAISKLQTYTSDFGAIHTHAKPELTFNPLSKFFISPSDRRLTQYTYTKEHNSACQLIVKDV